MKTNEETREDFMENMADKWRDKYFKLKKQHEAEIKQICDEVFGMLNEAVTKKQCSVNISDWIMEKLEKHLRGDGK